MRLREVGCPPRLAGLASWEDWRGSYLYSELILSVTERSALFVKELSFPQTAPIDDAFFNRNWDEVCGIDGPERVGIDGPVRWLCTLRSPAKTRNKEDRRGLAHFRSDA